MLVKIAATMLLAAATGSTLAVPRPAAGGLGWTAEQVRSLRETVAAILARPALRGAHVGLIAIDTVRGTVLYSRNADEEFMPASNFKLLTGSAALQQLGPNFSFVTRIAVQAPPASGAIAGDLYLRGGGDAQLSARDLDAAAALLAGTGVRSVGGAVVTDATHDDDQRLGYGWSWDDLPYYYAPVVSGLELEDGVAHVFVSPGASVGDPVRLREEPQTGAFTIENRATTGAVRSKDTTDVIRLWDEPRTIEVVGSYPLGAKESDDLEPSVPDPQRYAGDVLALALAAHGIAVHGGVRSGVMPPNAVVLWSHRSEPMPKLLTDFWFPSDNLMGELFLKELGASRLGEPGTDEGGAGAERDYLHSVGVDPTTATIADGSGLSQYDRITPRDLIAILQADWKGGNRETILDALPLAGVRGTLKDAYAGTPAERAVFAKTGSISHVRTLSGFIQTRSHGPVTFSLLINDWMGEDEPHGADDLAKLRGDLLSEIAVR